MTNPAVEHFEKKYKELEEKGEVLDFDPKLPMPRTLQIGEIAAMKNCFDDGVMGIAVGTGMGPTTILVGNHPLMEGIEFLIDMPSGVREMNFEELSHGENATPEQDLAAMMFLIGGEKEVNGEKITVLNIGEHIRHLIHKDLGLFN